MIQMKAKLTIYLYVALSIPSIINGEISMTACWHHVRDIAKENGHIEGIFQPTGEKPLGTTSYSFVFEGILLPIRKRIAMKITLSMDYSLAKREYAMYTYLDAINRPQVERFGIPAVYYYGQWNEKNATMLGISLLDKSIQDLQESNELFANDVNVLIIIRDFIIASKYMHRHAVRHNHIKVANMMVRMNRCFLIDFNKSSKMNERSTGGLANFASRRSDHRGARYPKDDWENFLYTICYALGAPFEWIGQRDPYVILELKGNRTETIEKIKEINSETVKKILVEFAGHVFDDGGNSEPDDDQEGTMNIESYSKRFPDYDRFFGLVNDEIEKPNMPKPFFTWLKEKPKKEAIKDLKKNRIPDITEINEPIDNDFSQMNYPDVNYELFTQFYQNWNASSSIFSDAFKEKSRLKIFDCFRWIFEGQDD